MGLMDSLEKLGIRNVSTESMFEKQAPPKPAKDEQNEEKKEQQVDETAFLLKKTFTCPVCDKSFKDLSVKSGRARLVSMKDDLRPVYENFEPLKYEAVVCPICGYAAMNRYMMPLTQSQRKEVRDKIAQTFSGKIVEKDTYTYDEAIERVTLALASAIVKRAKPSEKAYICLKGGWLCNAYLETLDPDDVKQELLREELQDKAKEFMDNAYEGFLTAIQEENYPIGGMDEMTLNYLLAVMSMERGKYDISSRMVAAILQSHSASARIKDKARDLKEDLMARLKGQK